MIGIVLTGHGNFASGLYSSVCLIGGEQKDFERVDFVQEMTTDQLEAKLKESFEKLPENIIVFADLTGGSPFKSAAIVSEQFSDKKITVIGGSNLAMVLEVSLLRNFDDDYEGLVEKALNTGKEGIVKFELKKRVEENFEDGI